LGEGGSGKGVGEVDEGWGKWRVKGTKE